MAPEGAIMAGAEGDQLPMVMGCDPSALPWLWSRRIVSCWPAKVPVSRMLSPGLKPGRVHKCGWRVS